MFSLPLGNFYLALGGKGRGIKHCASEPRAALIAFEHPRATRLFAATKRLGRCRGCGGLQGCRVSDVRCRNGKSNRLHVVCVYRSGRR